jgi:hypothetical protein
MWTTPRQKIAFLLVTSVTLFAAGCVTGSPIRTTTTAPSSVAPGSAPATADDKGPIGGDWKKWLEPPPRDEPQPRFSCAQRKYTAPPVWYDTTATYSWKIANRGATPLRVHVVT